MPTDTTLLRLYVDERDERAFAELVQRHLSLVYSAALWRMGGRTHLAEDISQQIFSDLARKARNLIHHPTLTGWLYRSTRYAAINAARTELRQQKLAQSLTAMPDESSSSEPSVDWDRLHPVLYEAMDQLKERDREIMLLRFFNGLTFAEIGDRLNLAENTARMRTERALDRLRVHLGKRGVTSTAAALGTLLADSAFAAAAPAGLATKVTTTALAAASVSGATGIASIFLMSKITVPVLSAALAAGLTVVVWTSFANDVSTKELAALRQENTRLTQATASPAAVIGEFAAIAQAVDRKHSKGTAASTANIASAVNPGGHRDHGQATAHDAMMSFAWACDVGDIDALSKLIWFDDKNHEKALTVLASMPESIRAQYPTPEKLYAFFLAAVSLVSPPPGSDVIERNSIVDLSLGRVATRQPGSTKNFQQYQQTPEGWKFVMSDGAVVHAPNILKNETLKKLIGP